MAEISKEFKIVLIINMIVGFIYGILYVFLPETVSSFNNSPDFDPHFWRLFGGAILAIAFAALLGIMKGDWENIKLFFIFAIIFLSITAFLNITSIVYVTRSATNLIFHWLDNVVIIGIAILDAFFYIREEKK